MFLFSPKLYQIRKLAFKEILDNNFNLTFSPKEETYHFINQQDNMLFRQVRMITKNYDDYNPYIIFVDCKGFRNRKNDLDELLRNGFIINGRYFVRTEKSASMSRNAILGFVDAEIEPRLNQAISMDLDIQETVISKYDAYRGLMFSSCFFLEDWIPKIVVIDDYEKIIPNQYIKFIIDKEDEFIDEETGEVRKWKGKGIDEGYHDISITPFDGCGIHCPSVTEKIKEIIGIDTEAYSFMWRSPFIKGVTHEIDFHRFFNSHNIHTIRDIWEIEHDINDIEIIMTKSMYKGFNYFKSYNDYRDWENYWDKFNKYNHVLGIAKWNYGIIEEPIYTRVNYQILQDLDLPFDAFVSLAEFSKGWVENIMNGHPIYTNCFLGLFADSPYPSNEYMRALLKNPVMIKEECVRGYLNNSLSKYIDKFKCGKLWLEGTFRILSPDLILFLEFSAGLEPKGALKSNEFYSKGIKGRCDDKWLIERNPHICASEHVVLYGTDNDILKEYCDHLTNVCMINSDSLTTNRLNGADFDGDLVLVIKNDVMLSGVHEDLPMVIDIEDKVTTIQKQYNTDNIIDTIILSMDNRIGEYSNVSTGYHNKMPRTQEQKNKYLDYINLVSVLNAKEIDFAKTGTRFNLPKYIGKYAKPLPYFMKFAGKYYSRLAKFSMAQSNMNRLCWNIVKWRKNYVFKHKFNDFVYEIMLNKDIPHREDIYLQIEELYHSFNKLNAELGKQNNIKKYYLDNAYQFDDISKTLVLNTKVNWKYYYTDFIEQSKKICPNQSELANYAVKLCYEKYPKRNKKFAWIIAKEGIISNIDQVEMELPIRDDKGKYEYLGRRYNLISYKGE